MEEHALRSNSRQMHSGVALVRSCHVYSMEEREVMQRLAVYDIVRESGGAVSIEEEKGRSFVPFHGHCLDAYRQSVQKRRSLAVRGAE
jgi:hypothetical protein